MCAFVVMFGFIFKNRDMTAYPFFNINSEPLKEMLAVKDKRSIINRLYELGVEIKGKGKSQYIITQDVIDALNEKKEKGYTGKSELSKMFK